MPSTIVIEAPNGAKVRTVRSRRYFVVSFFQGANDAPVARVVKRTDDLKVAQRERTRSWSTRTIWDAVAERFVS